MRRFRHLLAGLAALLALSTPACLPAQVPPASIKTSVYGDLAIYPTAFHNLVYREMEHCTGLAGDPARVQWHVADYMAIEYEDGTQGVAVGMWTSQEDGRHIFLQKDHVFDGEVISHEILHDLYSGDAPLDVAQKCILTYRRVHYKPLPPE